MSGREHILQSIRQRLGGGAPGLVQSREQVREALSRPCAWPLPAMAWDPLAQFRTRTLALQASLATVHADACIVTAVAEYLRANGLPLRLRSWSTFAALPWQEEGIVCETGAAQPNDAVGLTGCHAAIAETGALMLLSGPDTPALTSLLPETHIAVVHAEQVLISMEDVWQQVRRDYASVPRAVNFVAGPSRTGDVEQTTTIGVHGPRRVHVILVEPSVPCAD